MPLNLGMSKGKTYRNLVGLWSGEEKNKIENKSFVVERFTLFS